MKLLFRHNSFVVITFVLLCVCVVATTACNAQKATGSLLALSKSDHTLAIVDPSTLQVKARIPVGSDPHEVIASEDGKLAFVSIYGGGSLHELDVIDLIAQKPLFTVDTKPLFGPHGLAFAQGKLYFTAEGSKAVGSYDAATQQLDWCMGTGQDRTHMIYVTHDAKKIYTTNITSATVSILQDTLMRGGGPPPPQQGSAGNTTPPPGPQQREDWHQTIIKLQAPSEGFDVSPTANELWAASGDDGSISIIDVTTKKLLKTIDAKVNGANRLAFTTDGKLVFISSLQSGEVTIYDTQTRTEKKRLKVGRGAAGILMDPNGSRAFVACTPDDYIAIIDLKTLEVTGHLNVGGGPDGMAWAAPQ